MFGARAAVWSPTRSHRAPVTVVLPSPAVADTRPALRPILPGDPPVEEAAAARLDVRVPVLDAVDDGARARLVDDSADLAYAGAVLELGCWRYRVEHAEPGPDLAAALTDRPRGLAPGVGRGDPVRGDGLWADAVLASIQARARLISHLQAAQYADVAELSAHYPAAHEFLATEIALALSCTEWSAQGLLGAAEAFRDRLPATLAALSKGTIDEEKAHAILAATTSSSAAVASAVEGQVLPSASTITARTLRRRAERAVIACDPDGAKERHDRRSRERFVSRWAEADGMACLRVYSTAQDIAVVHEALTALADASWTPGDARDLGNRRVDALVDICTDILAGGGWAGLRLPEQPARRRPHIRVTVPITVLAGGNEPCELDGQGPITADQARAIAADGVLTRLVCDPLSGTLLDYGLTRYQPPDTLKEFVQARDRTCVMPICGQPAHRCDTDHIIAARPDPSTGLPTHGPTTADNLAPECRHHHLAKDGGGGYRLTRNADGSYAWTTPLGRTHRREPEILWHPPPSDRRSAESRQQEAAPPMRHRTPPDDPPPF